MEMSTAAPKRTSMQVAKSVLPTWRSMLMQKFAKRSLLTSDLLNLVRCEPFSNTLSVPFAAIGQETHVACSETSNPQLVHDADSSSDEMGIHVGLQVPLSKYPNAMQT